MLYSRLLVLEALEATQLSSVDLIHVQIAVYLQLILTDAERHRERQQTHVIKSFLTVYSSVSLALSLKRPVRGVNEQSRACSPLRSL